MTDIPYNVPAQFEPELVERPCNRHDGQRAVDSITSILDVEVNQLSTEREIVINARPQRLLHRRPADALPENRLNQVHVPGRAANVIFNGQTGGVGAFRIVAQHRYPTLLSVSLPLWPGQSPEGWESTCMSENRPEERACNSANAAPNMIEPSSRLA